jgi:adenylate cyclase
MAVEIERKFLVDKTKLPPLNNGFAIMQGYLSTNENSVVRVRIKNDHAFLTIKSKTIGSSRLEYEYPIPINDAKGMLEKLCERPILSKTRYEITYGNHVWELDIFYEENEGLIVAEIELLAEDESFLMPPWVTSEVTDDARYFNSNLINYPYKKWE